MPRATVNRQEQALRGGKGGPRWAGGTGIVSEASKAESLTCRGEGTASGKTGTTVLRFICASESPLAGSQPQTF